MFSMLMGDHDGRLKTEGDGKAAGVRIRKGHWKLGSKIGKVCMYVCVCVCVVHTSRSIGFVVMILVHQ
jgi:hypothetical protein